MGQRTSSHMITVASCTRQQNPQPANKCLCHTARSSQAVNTSTRALQKAWQWQQTLPASQKTTPTQGCTQPVQTVKLRSSNSALPAPASSPSPHTPSHPPPDWPPSSTGAHPRHGAGVYTTATTILHHCPQPQASEPTSPGTARGTGTGTTARPAHRAPAICSFWASFWP
jgi:hypothetical protein